MLRLAGLARCRHEASSGDQRERAPQCLHIPRRKAASFSPAPVHLENEGNAAKRVSVESGHASTSPGERNTNQVHEADQRSLDARGVFHWEGRRGESEKAGVDAPKVTFGCVPHGRQGRHGEAPVHASQE